ncbi:MAG TPA: DUF3108 domain-containing protein, partial [Gammaproteobacteria bacterium]|nr:DUF3108 domain-containing protein [Gammaproteobacteria bacterium]
HDRLLRPLVYAYTDSGHPDHNETISFDWDNDRAHDIRGGKEKLIPIAPGMLDRLTAQLEISRELAAGVPLTEPYLVVKGGEINAYHLRRDGQKKIDTPTGRFDTTVVVREDPDSHSTTVFWLAPQYRWLPVKIEQREPGEATYSFVLTHLQWLKQDGKP